MRFPRTEAEITALALLVVEGLEHCIQGHFGGDGAGRRSPRPGVTSSARAVISASVLGNRILTSL